MRRRTAAGLSLRGKWVGCGDDNSVMTFSLDKPPAAPTAALRLEGVAALPHLGVIRAQGEEAAKFLQGQLTHDFALWPAGRARLAGYCSPKGRLLASFVAVRLAADDFALVVSRDILPTTLKRLSMFVLRAKVRLTDASDAFSLHGLAGEAARQALASSAPVPWTDRETAGAHHIALYPADGMPRALRLAPAAAPVPEGPALDAGQWAWGEVRSGVAAITAAVVEAFVPQMLNYESVDGVNFKKGCYPGQEVVARAQFRGQIKRRASLALADGPLQPGQELFDPADPEQPCGLVAAAAATPGDAGGSCAAIVSVQQLPSGDAGRTLQTAGGTVLRLAPAPYPLLEDI